MFPSHDPNGIAVFNSSITEYQDFELPLSDMSDLIIKILKYAGVEIREPEVVQFALQEEKIDSETNT